MEGIQRNNGKKNRSENMAKFYHLLQEQAIVEEQQLEKRAEEDVILGVWDYTVILTYISLGIAFLGMIQAIGGNMKLSILCLALSGICDMFDGKIARTKKDRTHEEQMFGIQIDSLCDLVCFGVLPAIITYQLSMKHIFDISVLIVFLLAGLVRLAHFNVSEEKRQKEEKGEVRKYYQGLPITSIAIFLPVLYLLQKVLGARFQITLDFSLLLIACFYVFNIQIPKPHGKTIAIASILGGCALVLCLQLL